MMMRMLALLITLALAACESDTPPAPQPPGTQAATEWELGPHCENDQGSCGVPLHPTRTDEGFVIDVPQPPGHANYITKATGSLAGKTGIRIRYRVEGGPIRATKPRGEVYPGIITLYFAHRDNDFGGGPTQNWYRWFASARYAVLEPGTNEIFVRFDETWTAVQYGANVCDHDPSNDPDCLGPSRFQAALANAGRVGFVLGGGDGAGHGVHAEGPGARIVVTEFAVE